MARGRLFTPTLMKRIQQHAWRGLIALMGMAAACPVGTARAAVITFEDIALPAAGYRNASEPAGGFAMGAVTLGNRYDATYGSWAGFALSNHSDATTPGWSNQYSAIAGGGAAGSSQYAVCYASDYEPDAAVITFSTATDLTGRGAMFTNTTYAGLAMRAGDPFSKKFGGISGTDADWFKLTIRGWSGGAPTGTSVEFYLADFRFADSARDFIIDRWTAVDFTPLGTVDQLRFGLSSSDNGAFGMNTPAYFAMDNLVVPEPSTLLCLLAAAGPWALRRRR